MSIINGITIDGTLIKDTLSGIRTAITGKIDPEKAANIELKLQEMENALCINQGDTNKIEAQSSSLFVSGWRPFIGWTCGFGLLYTFLLFPIWTWISQNFQMLPPIDIDTSFLSTLIMTMLGMGTLRTIEKIKRVSRS